MPAHQHRITRETGYSPSTWARKLRSLYTDAKRRNGGASLTIYGDVSDMLDRLEAAHDYQAEAEIETLSIDLNNLAAKLRRE